MFVPRRRAFRAALEEGAGDVLAHVTDLVGSFSAGLEQDDDISRVVVKRLA